METNFQKIKSLLESSPLSVVERDELLVALLLVSDQSLEPVLELLEDDISWAKKLLANYKSKKGAVNHDDQTFWETIMNEEEATAASMEE